MWRAREWSDCAGDRRLTGSGYWVHGGEVRCRAGYAEVLVAGEAVYGWLGGSVDGVVAGWRVLADRECLNGSTGCACGFVGHDR